MCGIIGILGNKPVADTVLDGLKRLEYRGYDSAGIASLTSNGIDRRRAEGKLAALSQLLTAQPLEGTTAIGHTRWATHGLPTTRNAHPHATQHVALVHNGIIENYKELKDDLSAKGITFETDTDTEVVAQLITWHMDQGATPQVAVTDTLKQVRGAYALAIIFAGHNDLMIGARQGTPLAVGYGDGEMFLASDSYALAPMTDKICFLEDGDRVILTREAVDIFDSDWQKVDRPVRVTAQSGATTGKGNYRHFMLKEIYEQPTVIGDTLNAYINPATGKVSLPDAILNTLKDTPRLTIVACGTAFYAGMVAKYWFETLARIPVELDIASEFRYREAPMPKGGAALFISQSGETLDTLEALRYCKAQDQTIISVVNAIESTIERESDHVLHTLAGPEIGVASTKAFTTQLATLACLALCVSVARNTIDHAAEQTLANALRHIPAQAAKILNHDDALKDMAKDLVEARDVLYLGRGTMYPLALEGALKLKEISYIHAEGYAAGEMKHGPIALIDDQVPVVALAPYDELFEKTASNIQETVARSGKILLITDESGSKSIGELAQWRVVVEDTNPFVAPILYAIPVQLLAYHIAVLKGTDVDQPRNLAKSVTVE